MNSELSQDKVSRDYKCPCGKTYLSYPALFTHIKFKHQGNAPGDIQKPHREPKPRGRPSLLHKKKIEQGEATSKQTDNTLKQCTSDSSSTYKEEYEKLFILIKQIIFPQPIREQIWEQVDSFKEYQKFIDKTQNKCTEKDNEFVNVGIGLTQFLKEISMKCVNWRFQQILILFMFLLQYAIDQQNQKQIVFTQPVEVLIEYMNPFMNEHIQDYAEYLQIENLWALRIENIKKIFLCFYNWLKMRDYTSFCITLLE